MYRLLPLLLAGGCSFLMVTPPRAADAPCTRDRVPPIADTIGAIASVIAGTGLTFTTATEGGEGNVVLGIAAVFAVPVILYSVSAGYGFRATSRCRRR